MDEIGITFKAHFARFATQADGAVRLSLDLSPLEAMQAVKLLQMKDSAFQVALVPLPNQASQGVKW
jgi:hypothetical protein